MEERIIMKKILIIAILAMTMMGCSSVVATRTSFDISKTELQEDDVLTIVERILEEEGMTVSNMEEQDGYKIIRAMEQVEETGLDSTTEKVIGMALQYAVGIEKFKLYFVLDNGKMYLYGTLKNSKGGLGPIGKTTKYIDMSKDFGNDSLVKMNKIAARIKDETGIKGRVWNTTGKKLGSEYGIE
jgi:hypothetical protein